MKKKQTPNKRLILILKIFLINFFLFAPFTKTRLIIAEDQNPNISTDYLKNSNPNSFYIIGPGDLLTIVVKKEIDSLNGSYLIDGQGYINLPRLKKVYVSGLTINELIRILDEKYVTYLKEPEVDIQIKKYRPVKFLIKGEIATPGLHVLPGSSYAGSPEVNFEASKNIILSSYFPSLIDAIRKSEGITVNADLSNIEVIRKNSISTGGGVIKANINLFSFLEENNNEQNIRILDGDIINIPKSNEPSIISIQKAIQTNLNPKFISVIVSGRVENPGNIKVNKTSVLNDAIEIAGGAKIIKGPIRYVKFNNDGNIDRRKFNYSKSAKRGSYSNPYLSNGDIIYVGKGALASSAEVINEVTKPFQGLVTAITLYEFLSD